MLKLGNGIEITIAGEKLYLDPRRAKGTSFISHAHADHAPRSAEGEVVLSQATSKLLCRRLSMKSLEMGRSYEMHDFAVRLIESGHMLGASQLVVENGFKLVYTGDLHLEGGATCGSAKVERCDVLIIESTFGSPHYEFPPREEVIAELKDWIEEKHARGAVPVVLGYSLGKAQELTRYLSSHFCVEVHPAIYENNRRYEALGVALGEYRLFSQESREDRVVIFPPAARRSRALEKLNPSFAFMSGWAVHEGTRFRLGVEEALPLSDHSDFYSMLRYVEKASPQVVYTVHGFAEEFAEELRARGFYAEALVEKKMRTLEEYM